MKIYVACSFTEYERGRKLMADLITRGYEITHNWTQTFEFDDEGKPRGIKLTPFEQQLIAQEDIQGAVEADLMIVLADKPLCGALIEIGAAIAGGSKVWVVNPQQTSVFWYHPRVTILESEDSIFEFLEWVA